LLSERGAAVDGSARRDLPWPSTSRCDYADGDGLEIHASTGRRTIGRRWHATCSIAVDPLALSGLTLTGDPSMRTARSSSGDLTLLELVAVVRDCSRSSREAAAVVNHLLQSAQVRFARGAPLRQLQRLRV
jgi:hypothetical protein